MSITTDQYQHFKDRLLALLQKAHGMPGLLDQSDTQIEAARRRLQEDQFEIVLVGEFQGGKSTTFNNLCDGREISPRGKGGGGLKTSGCIVRAVNLSDPDESEHANVRWRSPAELLMGFDAVLRLKIRADKLDAQKGIDDEMPVNLLDNFNPATKQGRAAIHSAAKVEIKEWESNRVNYDPDDLGLIELVRFALIVAEFYDHPAIRAARAQNRYPISEIHRFVTFPETWQTRWENWTASAFNPGELLFAFVAQVDCHLHSPNLGRLGCAVTDCPGLFASSWDTTVAREAILRADAVLYLITGDRQLSQSDLKAIRSLGLGKGMIFVGANCRDKTWSKAGDILEANKSLLQNQGLDIQTQNIRLYHPLLALFSAQLERGVENLEPFTLDELRRDFELEQADPARIGAKLQTKITTFRDILDSNDDGGGSSYEKSRMRELLESVEAFVIDRKAEAILLGNGDRVRIALSETEASLQMQEDNALKTLQERQREYGQAELALNEFEATTKEILSGIGNDTHVLVAKTFMDQLSSRKEAVISGLSEKLSREIKKVELLEWSNPKRIVNRLIRMSENELKEWVQSELGLWLADIREGKNRAYRSTMTQPIKAFHGQIRFHWEQVKERKIPTLGGIDLPRQEEFHFKANTDLPDDFASLISTTMDEISNSHFIAALITAAVIVLITVVVLTSLSAPVLLVLVPILAVFFPKLKKDLFDGGKNTLKSKFNEKFHKFEESIEADLLKSLEKLVKDRKMGLTRDFIKHPRLVYTKIKKEAESQFQLAEGDRVKLAIEARLTREQHVAPLRQDCDTYLADVKPYFSVNG